MELFKWKDSFSVGHPEIDKQHQVWISIINDLHSCLMDLSVDNYTDCVESTLLRMTSYSEEHFQFEEKIMSDSGYPDLESHREIHQNFSRKINQIRTNFMDGEMVLGSEVMKDLKKWLTDHVLNMDAAYKDFINKS